MINNTEPRGLEEMEDERQGDNEESDWSKDVYKDRALKNRLNGGVEETI